MQDLRRADNIMRASAADPASRINNDFILVMVNNDAQLKDIGTRILRRNSLPGAVVRRSDVQDQSRLDLGSILNDVYRKDVSGPLAQAIRSKELQVRLFSISSRWHASGTIAFGPNETLDAATIPVRVFMGKLLGDVLIDWGSSRNLNSLFDSIRAHELTARAA